MIKRLIKRDEFVYMSVRNSSKNRVEKKKQNERERERETEKKKEREISIIADSAGRRRKSACALSAFY